jgi:hypothetical protein
VAAPSGDAQIDRMTVLVSVSQTAWQVQFQVTLPPAVLSSPQDETRPSAAHIKKTVLSRFLIAPSFG